MNIKTSFIAIALTVTSAVAFASSTETSVEVIAGESAKVFKLVYKSADAKRVRVSILNAQNNVVFTESINMGSFSRPYNFDGLPEGDYTIEVKDGNGVKVEKVSYRSVKTASLIKVTKVQGTATKYMLTVGGEGTNIVNVNILDADGNSIFQDAHITEGNFGVVYSLDRAGVYTFVVTDKTGESNVFMD